MDRTCWLSDPLESNASICILNKRFHCHPIGVLIVALADIEQFCTRNKFETEARKQKN